jgi:uncharacterized protein
MEWQMRTTILKMLTVHQRLDEELRREAKRRWPDIMRIKRLKKLKLAIKDRLYRIAGPRMA